MSTRIVDCPDCQGEGFRYVQGIVYEAGCGHAHRGEVCEGLCPTCNGACVVELDIEPVTLSDLDEQDLEELQAKLEEK